MKKIILFAAILFAGLSVVKAQEGTGKEGTPLTANTDLTVKLNPIHIITVNHTGILLEYKTTDDYESGVTSENKNHLTIYSTGDFQVTVNAVTDFVDAPEGMNVGTVSITANKNGVATSGKTVSGLNATDSDVLISSTKGGFGLNYDVTYKGGTDYMNLYSKNKSNEYKTNVQYTIVPL